MGGSHENGNDFLVATKNALVARCGESSQHEKAALPFETAALPLTAFAPRRFNARWEVPLKQGARGRPNWGVPGT